MAQVKQKSNAGKLTGDTYKIKPGDSLSKIALRAGTSVSALAKINGIKNPNKISAGKVLKLRSNSRTNIPRTHETHKVSRGENLWAIGKRYGTSPQKIMAMNSLSSSTIHPGQKLRIPGGNTISSFVSSIPRTIGRAVDLAVPWVSQYNSKVERHGHTACYRACRLMSRMFGVRTPASTTNRIQVAKSEDKYGRITENKTNLKKALNYIDKELENGRPVIAGVSHRDGYQGNRDNLTDHFVLITGKSPDGTYTHHDPSTKFKSKGANKKFKVEGSSGNLYASGKLESGYIIDRRQELSMVVPNIGTKIT